MVALETLDRLGCDVIVPVVQMKLVGREGRDARERERDGDADGKTGGDFFHGSILSGL